MHERGKGAGGGGGRGREGERETVVQDPDSERWRKEVMVGIMGESRSEVCPC